MSGVSFNDTDKKPLQVPNLQVITQGSDFLTQDSTTITLEANTNYLIAAAFSTAKRFIIQEGVDITANNFSGPVLTYTGTGVMFTSTDVGFTMGQIRFDAPNASRGCLYRYHWKYERY